MKILLETTVESVAQSNGKIVVICNEGKEFYDYVKNGKLLSNRVAAFKAGMEAAGKELSDAETTACKAATDLDNHSEIKEKFLTEWSHDMDDEEI